MVEMGYVMTDIQTASHQSKNDGSSSFVLWCNG